MKIKIQKIQNREWGVTLENQPEESDVDAHRVIPEIERQCSDILLNLQILQRQGVELSTILEGFFSHATDAIDEPYVSTILSLSEMLSFCRSLTRELIQKVEFYEKIKLTLETIEGISLSEAQCQKILTTDQQISFEEDEYIVAFPFTKLLAKQSEKKANSLVHTLEVCDAFMRLMNGDYDEYNKKRADTFFVVKQDRLTETINFKKPEGEVTELGVCFDGLRQRLHRHIASNHIGWKMVFFLLPLIHDIGKCVQLAAHPEIGADYFVASILTNVWRQAEKYFPVLDPASLAVMLPFVQQIVRSHVDIATIVTAERLPLTLKHVAESFHENAAFFMGVLTLLSLSDRSYGDRANELKDGKFMQYLNVGSCQSELWSKPDWFGERVKKFLPLRGMKAGDHEPTFRYCLGESIHIIDYGSVLFKWFNAKDPSGESLAMLFLALGSIIKRFDPDGNKIRRITLTKEKEEISDLYGKIHTDLFPFFRRFGSELRLMTDDIKTIPRVTHEVVR